MAQPLHPTHRPPGLRMAATALLLALGSCLAQAAADTTPAQQQQRFAAQAGSAPQAERGKLFFNSTHGGEWSCASCHGQQPGQAGKHASTGKTIAPMAPAFNPQAFTDSAKVDKWFRRNCGDVLKRECSASEKADVLAYLISVKP